MISSFLFYYMENYVREDAMHQVKPLLYSALAAVALSGCATSYDPPPITASASSEKIEHRAWEELRRVSIEARDELRLLAKAQQAQAAKSMTREQHEQKFFQSTYVPQGFEQIVQFRHIGPADQAAAAIAEIAGYEFQTFGPEQANPPIVNIDIEKRPLIDALHELGMQTGDRVRIEVLEGAKLIRLIYKTTG
jgi:hypothetical protein